MTGADREPAYRFARSSEIARDASRVEAFSDAVIAIVLTLMAVELLQFGPDGRGLPAALAHEWWAYLAYVITFAVVCQVWLTHHNMWLPRRCTSARCSARRCSST